MIRITPFHKLVFVAWIFGVTFVYLMLFGPREFWAISTTLGLADMFRDWWKTLSDFFYGQHLPPPGG